MDERQWSKARNLATAFGGARNEDVTVTLGEALLEVLAELLVPDDENEPEHETLSQRWSRESVARSQEEAKAQHPAYLSAPLAAVDATSAALKYAALKDATWVRPSVPTCEFCGSAHLSRCGYCGGHHPGEPIHEEEAGYQPHPQFLEGEAAYKAAPVGTRAGHLTFPILKQEDGWLHADGVTPVDSRDLRVPRRVLNWGNPA